MNDDSTYLIYTMLVIILTGFFLVIMQGCTALVHDRTKLYDVDCSQCTVKIKYDIVDMDDKLEVKGF